MIKLITTKEGPTAVLKIDSHLSRWAEQHNSIRTDGLLDRVLPMLHPGYHVIDAGANIGGWTVPLAERVGREGKVYAFEPMPPTFACLAFNTRDLPNVLAMPYALAEICGTVKMAITDNAGASHVIEGPRPMLEVYEVVSRSLDLYTFERLDFIKIDVEGSERRLLDGARRTIERHRPVVVCEINAGHLARYGNVPDDVVSFFASRNYWMEFFDKTHNLQLPQVDVLFLPR